MAAAVAPAPALHPASGRKNDRPLIVVFWLCAALVPVGPATARAAPAPSPTVAVTVVRLSPTLEPERASIEGALVRGLAAQGLAVIAPGDVRARLEGREELLACGAETCLLELARNVGAPYFVNADVNAARRLYSVSLRLLDSTDGRPLAIEGLECRASDPCPPVAANVEELARELGRKGFEELRVSGRTRPPARNAAAPLPPPRPVPDPIPDAALAAPPARRPRILPWALLAAGGALVGTSAALFALDGSGADCARVPSQPTPVCQRLRDTRLPALATGVAGLGALVGSALWLALDHDTDTALALGPSHVLLRTSF